MVWIFPIRPVPDNNVKKPDMFVFADMEDYRARGKNVDVEYEKLLAERKKQFNKSKLIPRIVVPVDPKSEPKSQVVIPPEIIGKKVKHKFFGIGTITAISDTTIDVEFDNVGSKKMVYKFCMEKKILEFV